MNDIEKLLGTLNDPEQELYWDECWDALMNDREASQETVNSLLRALSGQTEFVRIAAIRKLTALNIDVGLWSSELCNLLADEDHGVRSEALAAASHFLSSSNEVAAAGRTMRTRSNEYLSLRIKAAWYLLVAVMLR